MTQSDTDATTAEFRVLHTVKVRGFVAAEGVADSSGLDVDAVTLLLDAALEQEFVRHRNGRVSGYSLTAAGRERHEQLLADDVTDAQRTAVGEAYEAFLAPNQAFKELTTAHQLKTAGATLDTAGALQRVDTDVTVMLDVLASRVPRFAAYGPRFARARDAFVGGDDTMLAAPMRGSYHDVWMELHEDLLSTLGRERSDHDG